MVAVEALKIAFAEEKKAIKLYQRLNKEHPTLEKTLSFFSQ